MQPAHLNLLVTLNLQKLRSTYILQTSFINFQQQPFYNRLIQDS